MSAGSSKPWPISGFRLDKVDLAPDANLRLRSGGAQTLLRARPRVNGQTPI